MNIAIFTEDKNKFLYLLKELEDIQLLESVILLSTSDLENKEFSFRKNILKVTNINKFELYSAIDYCIFDVSKELTENYIYDFIENNCIALDASSYFCNDENIPTIVFEINKKDIKNCKNKNVINIPSAESMQLNMVLNVLNKKIKRVVVSSYQSTSSISKDAMDELFNHTKKIYENSFLPPVVFHKQVPFNVLPQIGELSEKNYYEEECRLIKETKTLTNVDISATCAIVPTFTCSCQSINIEFEEEVHNIEKIFEDNEDFLLLDDPENYKYATPKESALDPYIYISRLRHDFYNKNIVNMWTVADNLTIFSKNIASIIRFLVANPL